MNRWLSSAGMVLPVADALPDCGWADIPKYEEQFVYQLRPFDGKGYPETFIPRRKTRSICWPTPIMWSRRE